MNENDKKVVDEGALKMREEKLETSKSSRKTDKNNWSAWKNQSLEINQLNFSEIVGRMSKK